MNQVAEKYMLIFFPYPDFSLTVLLPVVEYGKGGH
jgi:hypothetical protein